MNLVSARLRDQVYDRTCVSAILSGKRIGLDFKLLDGIDGGDLRCLSAEVIVVIDAINAEIVGSGTLAIRGVARHAALSALLTASTAGSGHARIQPRQLCEITAIERQFFYLT